MISVRNNTFTPYAKVSPLAKPISQSRKRSSVNNVSNIDKSTASMQRRNRKRRTNIINGSLVIMFLYYLREIYMLVIIT